jgi:hypothetical protein
LPASVRESLDGRRVFGDPAFVVLGSRHRAAGRSPVILDPFRHDGFHVKLTVTMRVLTSLLDRAGVSSSLRGEAAAIQGAAQSGDVGAWIASASLRDDGVRQKLKR